MLNHIDIQGRLVENPELRMTQNQVPVSTFTIACNRDRDREQTDFINVVCWRGTAEFASKYFVKGQMAIVSGRLQSRKWEDRDGGKRTAWEVVADNIYFCGDKKPASIDVEYTEIYDDEEVPF